MAELVVEHSFISPPKAIWRAFTQPDILAQWYGPGVETTVHKLDVKPGGFWLNEMKFGEKSDLSRMEFKEVDPAKRLVWHHASADTDWNCVPNPMMPGWPELMLTTVKLAPEGAGTALKLTQTPLDARDAEIELYQQMAPNMSKGWSMGFAMIDALVS